MKGKFKWVNRRRSVTWIQDFKDLGYDCKTNPANNYIRYFDAKWRKLIRSVSDKIPVVDIPMYRKYINDYFVLTHQALAKGYEFDLGEGCGSIIMVRKWVEPYINKDGEFVHSLYDYSKKEYKEPQWIFSLCWRSSRGKGVTQWSLKRMANYVFHTSYYKESTKLMTLSNGEKIERAHITGGKNKKNDKYLEQIPLDPRYVKLKSVRIAKRGY
jgi:hypothetical protein